MPKALHDRSWFVWWEYHRSPYVYRDRRGVGRFAPEKAAPGRYTRSALPEGYVQQTLVPLLAKLLEGRNGTGNRELITGCLIALARLRPKEEVIPTITRYLRRNQEYAETAALALGISASPSALPILMSLAANRREARKWVRGSRINYRTRSFSLFGLGLWCHHSTNSYLRAKALALVLDILQNEANSTRRNLRKDTEVAALNALRLIVSGISGASGEALRKDASEFLVAYIQNKKKDDGVLRAHAVTALGLALGRHEDPTGQARTRLLAFLQDRRTPALVQQSAVIALGHMGRLDEIELVDHLDRYARKGRDPHARHLALIALAHVASDEARQRLLRRFVKVREKWTGLALAVLDAERRRRLKTGGPDKTIGDALQSVAGTVGDSIEGAAMAIAIGIQGYPRSVEQLQAAFDPKVVTLYNAYVAEGLGLLHAESSAEAMKKLARRSLRHPAIFSKTALALGQLGTREVGDYLGKLLRTRRYTVERASAALALGQVGGVPEADLLIKIVRDHDQEDRVRGFAVVALGVMGEPTPLPWHHALMQGVNYLAITETLAGGGKGVLEIL